MTRRLLIHSGLCATGADPLQRWLSSSREALRRDGVLYPFAGTSPGGMAHDNIAFQVGRFAGFRAAAGDLKALFSEVAGHSGDVVISSAFFEYSLLYPERWAGLAQAAREEGLSVHIVVYSRPVVDQLRASFNHITLASFGNEFPQVARTVLSTGSVRLWDRHFCFSLAAIARAVARVPGVEITFRHHESLSGGSVVSDFAALLGVGADPPATGQTGPVPEPSVLDLLRAFLVYRDRQLGAEFAQVSELVEHALAGPRVHPVVPRSMALELVEKYEVRRPKLEDAPGTELGVQSVNMARLYSAETLVTLRQLLRARPDRFNDGESSSPEEQAIDRWREWIADVD